MLQHRPTLRPLRVYIATAELYRRRNILNGTLLRHSASVAQGCTLSDEISSVEDTCNQEVS